MPDALQTLAVGAAGSMLVTGASGVKYWSLAPVSAMAVSEMIGGAGWQTTEEEARPF